MKILITSSILAVVGLVTAVGAIGFVMWAIRMLSDSPEMGDINCPICNSKKTHQEGEDLVVCDNCGSRWHLE